MKLQSPSRPLNPALLTSLVLLLALAPRCLPQPSPAAPADPKLQAAYQRLHFDRLFPADAVALIQTKLQSAPRAAIALNDLAPDPRPDVRVLVATLLGELPDPDAAKPLWRLTLDPIDYVRTAAAGSLVHLATTTPITAAPDGLKDPRPDVRKLTAALLGQVSDKSAEPALLDVIHDPDPAVRAEIIGSLGACGSAAAVPSLVEALHDDNAAVRTAAASALAHFDDPTSVPALLAALNDPDFHVRAAAIMSASRLADRDKALVTKIIDPIAARLQDDPFALVRDRAADALARPDDEKAVAALVHAIVSDNREARFDAHETIISCKAVAALPDLAKHVHDPNRDVREKIITIFGAIGGHDQLPFVTAALDDADPVVRLAAMRALSKLPADGMLDAIAAKTNDTDPDVRAESARALGNLGDRKAVPKLVELLHDDNGFVRSAAAESLGKLGDRTATLALIQVLTGDKPRPASGSAQDGLVISDQPGALPEIARLKLVEEKINATKALGDIRDPAAVDALIEHGLKADDPGLRAESAVSLGKIGEATAEKPLEATVRPYYDTVPADSQGLTISTGAADESMRLRKEKESRVRASVAWALGQIADPSARDILRRAMNDENSLVRDAAAEALARITEKQERLAESHPAH
ncbi:MAG TPA: HEAT repeat domain-containing protein [Verrucomicrobiae bacterium]|nr:HEAT repeat domain-containing protein [Verrucomicrobiae bacterium]